MARYLLKLSGEALAGDKGTGLDETVALMVAKQVNQILDKGDEVAVVIGGGNFWRGRTSKNIDRTKADQIGMLATVMNCIYVSEIFRSVGMMTNILTPFECGSFTKLFSKDRANKYFEKGLVVFKDAWDFFEARNHSYTQKSWQNVKMTAEGIVNGKVVCTEEKMPSRRSTKLRLYVDEMGKKLVADGSDFVVVVCEVTDDLGHVRRLAKDNIRFTIEGEGEIIGDASINANPRAVEWGSAPVLIRSTRQAGRIKIRAEVQFPGIHAPTPAELEIESVPYDMPLCLASDASNTSKTSTTRRTSNTGPTLSDAEKNKLLQEVEAQQADFGLPPQKNSN